MEHRALSCEHDKAPRASRSRPLKIVSHPAQPSFPGFSRSPPRSLASLQALAMAIGPSPMLQHSKRLPKPTIAAPRQGRCPLAPAAPPPAAGVGRHTVAAQGSAVARRWALADPFCPGPASPKDVHRVCSPPPSGVADFTFEVAILSPQILF
jgi:hypothetical protein